MTKTEYEKARYEHWRHVLRLNHDRIVDKVADDVEAAEAAGHTWDPEEEPLPERIAVGGQTRFYLYGLRGKISTGELTKRDYEETARRFNLWRDLESFSADTLLEPARCHDCRAQLRVLLLCGKERA